MPAKIDVDSWSTQLRKGLAELCVLAAVRSLGEAYGYQLVQFLRGERWAISRPSRLLPTKHAKSPSRPAPRYMRSQQLPRFASR